jgi:hypothetical protein
VASQSGRPRQRIRSIQSGLHILGGDSCLRERIVLSLEAIMLALRLVALALGAFRPFSQVFDLTSGPIVQGWVA